ncbi:MAG: hypothetical protein H0U89_11335 [Acidimicrobiia bacterium]|nr:hypothetical protein [Acidimicrobiia bacterium]
MPWCDDCSRFWNPNSLRTDGACPTCERTLVHPGEGIDEDVRTPWHFKLLVAAVIAYLAWRAVQLAGWVLQQL